MWDFLSKLAGALPPWFLMALVEENPSVYAGVIKNFPQWALQNRQEV